MLSTADTGRMLSRGLVISVEGKWPALEQHLSHTGDYVPVPHAVAPRGAVVP